MCTYTESVMDRCRNSDSPELTGESNWLEKYLETENIFVDYLKSIMVATFNVDPPIEAILPECDVTESGFEALDNLCDLLASLCENNDAAELSYIPQISDQDKSKKREARSKRTLKCLTPNYGKESQVKPNRARSHSSVDVNEILRTHELIDVNSSDSNRRKSRRVSLGMRPKFSNWSRVKGAFKRDKSNSRIDSKDADYPDTCYSGDESIERGELHFSSSHENINQLSSTDEEFEYYSAGYPDSTGLPYQADDEQFSRNPHENVITKSKSAIIQVQSKMDSSPHVSASTHKNPFKWYRTKSAVANSENGPQEGLPTPPCTYKNCRFLYDEDSINKIENDTSGPSNEPAPASNEVLQEVQNKYESLQKRLSHEFSEKYHDWRKGREGPTNDDDEKYPDETKLSPLLADQSLSPRFKQKFQEWQKIKGLSVSPTRTKSKTENFNPLKKSKSDWHKWRPGSKSESNVNRFLDKEIGESSRDTDSPTFYADLDENLTPTRSKKHPTKINQPVEKKELAWLEKELQKVAREKQRLEKEKEKYAERETRLQNMKSAIKSGRKRKQEVLVPTSTGLFRFQGISSKFTRKLYEWEKAKGITPESSTFTLLDSSYGGDESQPNSTLQNMDIALLSRSRSVGSVEVAGVSASMLQTNGANHQQSSLSLNDMEQLEEAHLNVGNDDLIQSASSQQFDTENDDDFDLISNAEYGKCSTSHSIPLSSPSIKTSHNQNHNQSALCSLNYAKQNNESGEISEGYCAGPRIMFHPIQTHPEYEPVSYKKEQRDSANADARSIVDQIKKLRARTSIDDEDRINILTNLEHLADQLVDMVHTLNNHKNENSDELAVQIAELAVALKKKIKLLTYDELRSSRQNSTENFFAPEDTYADTEDNDSPTVHCTFTLPSWRVKHTTPSSTESESYTTRNRYVDTRQTKTDRQRKYFKDDRDNSSGVDENYDGSDETTLYIDLRSLKNKERRESSDNISTSNSESLIPSDTRDFSLKYSPFSEPSTPDDQNIIYCSLTLDGQRANAVKERKLNAKHSTTEIKTLHSQDLADAEVEQHLKEHENQDSQFSTEVRCYSPKPVSSKRKCSSCGKIKRLSKSRKNTSNNYCVCSKKESEESEKSSEAKHTKSSPSVDEATFPKLLPHSNNQEVAFSKSGKIYRSKVYDFNSFKNSDKLNTSEADVSKQDRNSINVIVPTTRKIFAPLRQNENGGASAVVSFTIDEAEGTKQVELNSPTSTNSNFISPPWMCDLRSKSASPAVERKNSSPSHTNSPLPERVPVRDKKKSSLLEMHANVDKLPPASPLSPKRVLNKDNNSSIRMMIAHYNKLMLENPEKKSADSSCWTTSIQKSPVVERRTRFENITCDPNNIRKSKSAVLSVKNAKIDPSNENCKNEKLQLGIVKSSSTGALQLASLSPIPRLKSTEIKRSPPVRPRKDEKKTLVKQKALATDEPKKTTKTKQGDLRKSKAGTIKTSATIASFATPVLERNTSFDSVLSETKLRNMKLQEAKNKFFSDPPENVSNEGSPESEKIGKSETSSRNSQEYADDTEDNQSITDAENVNYSSLLNKSVSTGAIDDRTKGLPACEKSPSKSKFGFSSIASKFRKVKMRRHKEPEVSAVSSLCRASLMMSIDREGKQREYLNSSKSCPSSPVMARSISKRNSSSN